MGDEDLCFSNPFHAYHRELNCEVAHPSVTKTLGSDGIHLSTHGGPLPPPVHCVLSVLSRPVLTAQLHHPAITGRWHVGAFGRIPSGYPKCYKVIALTASLRYLTDRSH
jgi:hypothetical protein